MGRDEFEFHEEDRHQRERRRKRFRDDYRTNATDDALGMAAAGDSQDGSDGDLGEWAGGLVDEQRPGFQSYKGDWNDQDSGAGGRGHYQRPPVRSTPLLDPNQPSPAVERAARLMERANRRTRRSAMDEAGYSVTDRRRDFTRNEYYDQRQAHGPLDGLMASLGNIGDGLGMPDLGGLTRHTGTVITILTILAIALCGCLLLVTAWIASLFGVGFIWPLF
jgi:hypothetical protein